MRRPIHLASIAAAEQWTPAVQGSKYDVYSISIGGTFEATVSVQRSIDGETWRTVKTYEAPEEIDYEFGADSLIRVGVDTGDFTSGPVEIQIAE